MHLSLKSLILNFGTNIFLKLIGLVIGLYQLYWLTSQASVYEYFQYNLGASYLSIVALVAGFGIYTILQKSLTNTITASKESANTWTTLFILRLGAVVIGTLVAYLVGSTQNNLFPLLTTLLFTQSALVLIDYNYFAVYAAKGDVWKFTLTDLGGKLITTLGLLLWFVGFKVFPNPVLHFLVVQIIGTGVSLLLDYGINFKRVIWGRFDMKILKSLLPSLSLIGFSWLILGLYQQSQAVVLTYFGASPQVVNGFVQAFVLVSQAILAVGILNTQIASNIKQVISINPDINYRIKYFWKNIGLYFVVLSIGYFALVLLGSTVLSLIDSRNLYTSISAPLLPILGIYIITSSISGVLSYFTIFHNQEKSQLLAVLIQLVLSFLGFALLLPNYGVYGVAWTVVLVSCVDVFVLRLPLALKLLTSVDKPSL